MNREAMLHVVRSLTREVSFFIVALFLFMASAIFWQLMAPFFLLLLLLMAIRGWQNFRKSMEQYYAGISKWPPLSREDCRVAQSKLKRKTDKNRPRYV